MEKVKVQIVWNKNYGAALDLLPGCVVVDYSLSGVKDAIRSAIELHLKTMCEDGDVIPTYFNNEY